MNRKIPILLAEYERQTKSPSAEKSSLAYASKQFTSDSEAERKFRSLQEKLLRIEKWNHESGVTSFELFDPSGNEARGKNAAVNDFIKITLPGSGKDDWVKIIEIHENSGEMILTVQPSRNPTEKSPAPNVTSHFFTDDSTNNFCLERQNETLNFYVIGLGEKSNTENTTNFIESVRNFATANIGHYLGIQKGEWTVFCESFLEIENGENPKS